MLTLLPVADEPHGSVPPCDELLAIWGRLDPESRKAILFHARAVAEVKGRVPPERPAPAAPRRDELA